MYPDILGTNTKKVEHEVTSKRKKYGHSSRPTWNENVGKCFINYYYLTVKGKKTYGAYILCSDVKLCVKLSL